MDEALWLPTEKSVRLALRTQQVIAYESGVADTIDPLGGSYLVEELTDQIAEQAMAYIRKIDTLGGALAAIETGYMQQEIQEAAYRYQKAVEKKEQVVVGVNAFEVKETLDLEHLKADPAIEAGQKARLAAMRANRDSIKVAEMKSRLEESARARDNLMPVFIECVENSLTLGEICGVLRQTWGEYQPGAWI
jgi:methylmalonyl-CoA mutase N-terminal domain/subunit